MLLLDERLLEKKKVLKISVKYLIIILRERLLFIVVETWLKHQYSTKNNKKQLNGK